MNIVVTGGSSGIGYVLTRYLAYYTGTVYTCSRSKENPHKKMRNVHYFPTDLSKVQEIKNFIVQLPKKIDVIILNAAIVGIPEVDGGNSKDLLWRVNVEANVQLITECLPRMKNGKIVFISSGTVSLEDLDARLVPYVEAKKFVEDFLVKTVPPEIDLLVLRPGVVATRLHSNLAEKAGGKIGERHISAKENKTSYKPIWIAYVVYLWIGKQIKLNKIHSITPEEADAYNIDSKASMEVIQNVKFQFGIITNLNGDVNLKETLSIAGFRLLCATVLVLAFPQLFENDSGIGLILLVIILSPGMFSWFSR